MKAAFEGAALSRAAAWIGRLTPAKPTIPILGGVLIDATDAVSFSAFDYDTLGVVRPSAVVHEPGRALVSGVLLAEVVKTASSAAEVIIDVNDVAAVVRAGRSEWTLPLIDHRDYPQLPDLGEPVGEVEAAALSHALTRVLPMADHTKTAPLFGAVALVCDGDTISIATTDRYRLAVAHIPWKPAGELDVVVPYDVLEQVARATQSSSGSVKLSAGSRGFGIATDTHSVQTRVLDRFVPWQKQIPSDPDSLGGPVIAVPTAELRKAVGRVLVVLDDEPVQVALGDGEITLHGEGRKGKAHAVCDVLSQDGNDFCITVRPHYLRDAAEAVSSPTMLIRFGASAMKPLLVTPADEHGEELPGYHHVVAPIHDPAARSAA